MKPPVTPPGLTTLRRHWHRWTAVVALHARRRGAQVVDAQEYQTLRQELVAACVAAGGAADGSQQEFYQSLADLARPWLSARALEQADREILRHLLARCRQAEQELSPRSRGPAVLRWVAGFSLLGAVAAVTVLAWKGQGTGLPPPEWPQGRMHAVRLIARGAGGWFVLGALALLLVTILIGRGGRDVTR
jgi:hypothetical protein